MRDSIAESNRPSSRQQSAPKRYALKTKTARLATKPSLLSEQQTDVSMSTSEPRSASGPTLAPFLIGKNRHGDWVVQDTSGMRGGLFVDRTQALKFAMWECGNRPQAVIMVPEGLELDMSARPSRELALRR
jgi:hypothetical protein